MDTALPLVKRASDTVMVNYATSLDIALTEHYRRFGNTRFRVVSLTVREGKPEFTVVPA